MSNAIAFVIRKSGILLVIGSVGILVFVFSVCLSRHDLSGGCIKDSAQLALGLLMAMDTPPNMLKCSPAWLVAFGWAVSLAGWLFVPLFVGQIVATALSRAELDSEYAMKLRQLGLQLGLSGQQLEDFVARTLTAKNEVFSRLKKW